MTRGVFKTDLAEDDGNLNDTIEIQVSLRNLPRNKAGKLEKCEITGKRPAMHDDWSELVVDGTEVNESPDSARSVSLAQVLALMQNRDRLIFCVVLTPRNSNEIYFNEFRKQTERVVVEQTGEEDSEEDTGKVSMAACFKAYSHLETLGGDDQWYCNVCKEHRDITKKLELYRVPKILCIHLKRFTQRKGMP